MNKTNTGQGRYYTVSKTRSTKVRLKLYEDGQRVLDRQVQSIHSAKQIGEGWASS